MQPRQRLFCAFAIALIVGAASLVYRVLDRDAINDLYFPLCGGAAVLQGIDPYGGSCEILYQGKVFPPNPLTTVLVAVPFAPLGLFGSALLWACGTGLLVYGLLKDGEWWRLLVLVSGPYWQAFLTHQWSPLILAVALLPGLLPLAMVKPQTGLPVILTNLTWRRALACAAFLLLTFVLDPTWPLRWLPQTQTYNGYVPLLALPVGLLLPLVLIRWREKHAQFLFLMSIVPQRGLYDLLSLWSVVENRRQLVVLNLLSWALFGLAFFFPQLPFPVLSVTLIHLPLVLYTLREPIGNAIQGRRRAAGQAQ
ncbi:MAG: hypothetical protein OHK0022_21100 [Roseiflexaceae bacterium]